MSQVKFEGDVSLISPRQLEYISEVLNSSGFRDAKAIINAVGEAGDNYVANVKRIIVDNNGEIFKIIAKVAPKREEIRSTMNTRTYFLNEHIMYTEVLPKYVELQNAAGIPIDKQLRYANCYGTLIDEFEELILLEDLTESGFTMLNKFKPLTDEDIRLVLKNFARLHSLSYALKYKEPDTYNNLTSKFVDFLAVIRMLEIQFNFLGVMEENATAVCDSKYAKHIKGTFSGMVETGKKISEFEKQSRFSVLQQGDAWTNNILFKLQEGKSVACCMIDYQLSRVNSPVADIHYLIFNCSDHESRKQHYLDWIDYYHSELENHLFDFGLKVNFVYPRDQLDADLKRHAKLSVGVAFLVADAVTKEKEAAQEMKDMFDNMSSEDMVAFAKSGKLIENKDIFYKKRLEGIIDTCLEFGLL